MTRWDAEAAEWYAANYGEYATNRLAVDALDLPADSVIVDVGCGTGSALRRAAAQVTGGRLLGIDPVPRMIEIARERTDGHPASSRIEFIVGPAEHLPVGDGLADFVFAFDSIDHWQDRDRGLRETRRILRDGGTFVIVKDGGAPGAGRARRTLVDALGSAGFVVVQQRDIAAEAVKFTLWTCVEAVDPSTDNRT